MRLSPRRRTAPPTLKPAPAVRADRVAELLRRYDPDARGRRRRITLKNGVRGTDRAVLPAAVGELRAAADLYECGIDDVHGPTEDTAPPRTCCPVEHRRASDL